MSEKRETTSLPFPQGIGVCRLNGYIEGSRTLSRGRTWKATKTTRALREETGALGPLLKQHEAVYTI